MTEYRGRFAPSPTGKLHFGSLITAVASYAQARSRQGSWLIRMEDLDRVREVPGSADQLIMDLGRFGMTSDEPVLYQSTRDPEYQNALSQLERSELVFHCGCTRRELNGHLIYPGTCENGLPDSKQPRAIRVRVPHREHPHSTIGLQDQIQGLTQQCLSRQVGAFVVRRADQLFAYQLAVVVDDADQRITEIVRGCDLLDSTPRQIYLQRCLGLPTPDYAHVPLAIDSNGAKLSKQLDSQPVDPENPVPALRRAWGFLGQPDLSSSIRTVEAFWRQAIGQWDIQLVPPVQQIPAE